MISKYRTAGRTGSKPTTIFVGTILTAFPMALLLVAWAPALRAAGDESIAGDYLCVSGCRVTDAAPNIAVDGHAANCMNELGGLYRGRLLVQNSVYCFNKIGTLSADGRTVQWSDGAVWKRLAAPAR